MMKTEPEEQEESKTVQMFSACGIAWMPWLCQETVKEPTKGQFPVLHISHKSFMLELTSISIFMMKMTASEEKKKKIYIYIYI